MSFITRENRHFPAQWSKERIAASILEAYEEFVASGRLADLRSNGVYKLQGFTKEGIEIEMYITKNGLMKTAYPIVRI